MCGEHVELLAILALSHTANFSLHSLPRHVSVELGLTPEQLRKQELERERTDGEQWAFPWGG